MTLCVLSHIASQQDDRVENLSSQLVLLLSIVDAFSNIERLCLRRTSDRRRLKPEANTFRRRTICAPLAQKITLDGERDRKDHVAFEQPIRQPCMKLANHLRI